MEPARGVGRAPSGWSKVICEGFSPVRTRTVCHARAPSDHCVHRSRSVSGVLRPQELEADAGGGVGGQEADPHALTHREAAV